jgi:hypothetical protein
MAGDTVTVQATRECMLHKTCHFVYNVPLEDYQRYQRGARIQDALPTLTADQREILLTGTCQEAWDQMFAAEECDEDCDGSSHPDVFCK